MFICVDISAIMFVMNENATTLCRVCVKFQVHAMEIRVVILRMTKMTIELGAKIFVVMKYHNKHKCV